MHENATSIRYLDEWDGHSKRDEDGSANDHFEFFTTGRYYGTSITGVFETLVFQLAYAFAVTRGKKISHFILLRCAGDLPEYYADPRYAQEVLSWQERNPHGYT